ncbi:MAG: flagellar basal body-associated FliL family protein [Treponema sp.]|nr:flagellar basal body-associated FliL family protein [Treponema sp.]
MKAEQLNKILLGTAAAVALAIAGITAAFFIKSKGAVEAHYRKSDPSPQKIVNMSAGKENSVDAFTDLGQIRISSKRISENQEPAIIVVSPWFSYPAGDKTLFEELSQKERQIRAQFTQYFSSMTLDEIRAKGESEVKEDLLRRINAELVMGKVRAVYFNEYIFID